MELWLDYLKTFGWGIVGAVTMAVSLWILLRVFTWLTPVDEWEELKKGNLGIAIIMAAVILGFAIVVGFMVAPGEGNEPGSHPIINHATCKRVILLVEPQ